MKSSRLRSLATTFALTVGCADVLGLDDLTFESSSCELSSEECGGAAAAPRGSSGLEGSSGGATHSMGAGAGHAHTGGSAGERVPGACTNHRECIETNAGEPHLCKNARCVALKNSDRGGACRVVLGENNLEHPTYEPFVFGALASVDRPSPASSVATLNYLLAIEDFAAGFRVAGKTRLPVAVVCDHSPDDLARLSATFEHLVSDLGVSAVVSPLQPFALESIFQDLYRGPRPVFFLSPFDSHRALLHVTDGASETAPGLLWHLLGNPAEVAEAYVPLVQRMERRLSLSRGELRLALVESTDLVSSEMAAFLDQALVVDGAPANGRAADRYLRLQLGADAGIQTTLLREFEPHIVVSVADNRFRPVLRDLEMQLEQTAAETRPFYALSPIQSYDPLLLETVSNTPGLRERVVGVNYAAAADPTLYNVYLSRLKSRFPERTDLESTENFYDAIYYLLYAAAAGATTDDVTGHDVARGMWRLIDGPKTSVGPAFIDEALGYLADDAARTIALWGTLGAPDFDRLTGGRHGTGSIWCVNYNPLQFVHYFEKDVLLYEGGSLKGEDFPCFDF